MKTIIEELIEELKANDVAHGMYWIKQPDVFFEKYLEKEKEQIMNAYCDGAKGGANGNKGQHENGWVSIQMRNKYYNQTFNQNK